MTDPAEPAPVSRDTRPCTCPTFDGEQARSFFCPIHSEETRAEQRRAFAEASEDTEPARCQTCQHPPHDQPCRFKGQMAAVPVNCMCGHPAPASDDEMTPGPSVDVLSSRPWAPYKDASGFWRYLGNHGRANVVSIPAEVEAAIRAQADEAWRNDLSTNWRTLAIANQAQVEEYRTLMAAVTAERDRLLKVAYEDARTLHYVTHLTKSGVEDFNDCDQEKCVNARAALAAPATEEVQDA